MAGRAGCNSDLDKRVMSTLSSPNAIVECALRLSRKRPSFGDISCLDRQLQVELHQRHSHTSGICINADPYAESRTREPDDVLRRRAGRRSLITFSNDTIVLNRAFRGGSYAELSTKMHWLSATIARVP